MRFTKVQPALELLGFRVTDRITKFKGVVTSVSFDLYGCIQAFVSPDLDSDGKIRDGYWFDCVRLDVDDGPVGHSPGPVLPPPAFDFNKGGNTLPPQRRV